ncbi:RNA-guided endonuclease InsQ/TnpB family protein [Scytonema sp. PCC 10023]|uniref:RNA-guided endonuclease InsQ/TnpB family protein n=1 Tax=Scytonema sp. PCC 10023 TaxID=1680591 RepID=UPI0039C612AC
MATRRATFRLYPTKLINQTLHYHRKLHKDLWNAAVYNRKTQYQKLGHSVDYYEQQNSLPAFKQMWVEYKNVNSQALQATVKRVDIAFQRFFSKLGKYPKFKSARKYKGWTYPATSGWKAHTTGKHGYLELTKIGQIRMRGEARLWGTPTTCTIFYKNGEWYASITVEIDDVLLKKSRSTRVANVVAIDMGCENAATLAWISEGETEVNGYHQYAAPQFLRKTEAKIKKLSKQTRRKQAPNYKKKIKASKRWKKASRRVGKLHILAANQRQNWIHKVTRRISLRHGTIVTEALNVQNMTKKANKGSKRKRQKAGLNKSILDVGISRFLKTLEYKVKESGGVYVELPTKTVKPSQTCPKCGTQKKKELSERVHQCSHCGYTQQRDKAACEVMLSWAFNNLSGCGTRLVSADGLSSTSSTRTHKDTGSMKQLSRVKRS